MNKKRISQISLAVIILLFLTGFGGWVGLQLIPGPTNPPIVSEPQWDSPQTQVLVERACFDCHSNETKWPWYSKVPFVSQTIKHEVREGRESLNYSEWNPRRENESIETILQGRMPPKQYLAFHPEARLTDTETKALIAGLRATFGNSVEGEENEQEENEERENHREAEEGNENHEENDND